MTTYSALRVNERTTAALMSDPDVTGDLLLVGMWLSRAVHLHQPAPTSTNGEGWQLTDIADHLFPLTTRAAMFTVGQWDRRQETGSDVWRVVDILKKDIRRYDMWADMPRGKLTVTPCGGPMIRRETCGKRAHTWWTFTTPETGRKYLLGACSKHMDWLQAQSRDNRAACAETEVPRPPANTGGALARHIDIDWPALWLGLDPQWTAPPEVDSWVRPKLQVLVGRLEPRTDGMPPAPRPKFGIVNGALSVSEPILT